MDNKITKEENKTLKKLKEKGFVPDEYPNYEEVYEIGTPYPIEILAQWWAFNGNLNKHKLIGFRAYKLEE